MPITHRSRAVDTRPADEKVTVNLGAVDLGQIDLLVAEGFYGNRSDLIRTAVRNQVARHAEVLQQAVARRELVLGVRQLGVAELEAAVAQGRPLALRVLGLATIAADVTPALARAAIDSIEILGALHASAPVKAALAGRIR